MGKLTKYFVEPWDVLDFLVLHHSGVPVEDPEVVPLELDTADVSVGPEEDVLQLGLFLVNLFNCFAVLHL